MVKPVKKEYKLTFGTHDGFDEKGKRVTFEVGDSVMLTEIGYKAFGDKFTPVVSAKKVKADEDAKAKAAAEAKAEADAAAKVAEEAEAVKTKLVEEIVALDDESDVGFLSEKTVEELTVIKEGLVALVVDPNKPKRTK